MELSNFIDRLNAIECIAIELQDLIGKNVSVKLDNYGFNLCIWTKDDDKSHAYTDYRYHVHFSEFDDLYSRLEIMIIGAKLAKGLEV